MLEAALYLPQTGYSSEPIEEAAALWESLAQKHPFIDGNERTAFAATMTFRAVNHARLTATADETYVFIRGFDQASDFTFDRLAPWLRANLNRST